MARSAGSRIFLVVYLAVVHLLAIFFVLDKVGRRSNGTASAATDSAMLRTESASDLLVSSRDSPQTRAYRVEGPTDKLLIPVVGVKRKDLVDTYEQSRSGGRVHNAIDIMAPEGTQVVAVADGPVAKFHDSQQGGITVYQWSADKRRVYYYAHLQARASGLAEGQMLKRGDAIGFVGHTGNAGEGNNHLHFSIILPPDTVRHWDGEHLNPYTLLKDGIEVVR